MDQAPPPVDLRRLIQSLANRALEDSLRNFRHHAETRRMVARGELTDTDLNAAYADYVREEGPRYRQTVADLTVRYYAALAELGTEFSRRFYELAVPGRPAASRAAEQVVDVDVDIEVDAEPEPVSVQRVPLELHAPAGSVATGTFSLENRLDRRAEVTFDVSPWTGSDGTVARVPVAINPPALHLEPRGRAHVSLSVRVVPEVFAEEQLYTARVGVTGYDGLELLLTLWVEPHPEEPPAPPQPAPAPATARRRKAAAPKTRAQSSKARRPSSGAAKKPGR